MDVVELFPSPPTPTLKPCFKPFRNLRSFMEEYDYADMIPEDEKPRKEASVDVYLDRLNRRGKVIQEIRNAYLRDVVALKQAIEDFFPADKRGIFIDQWTKNIPSIDLSEHLMLASPNETSLNVIPCNSCGGSVEIVHHDSAKLHQFQTKLTNVREEAEKSKEKMQLEIATKAARIEQLEQFLSGKDAKHNAEKRVLFSELKDLKAKNDELKTRNEELFAKNQQYKHEATRLEKMCSETSTIKTQLKEALAENSQLSGELNMANKVQSNNQECMKDLSEKLDEVTKKEIDLRKDYRIAIADLEDTRELLDEMTRTAEARKKSSANFEQRCLKLQRLLDTSTKNTTTLLEEKKKVELQYSGMKNQLIAEQTQYQREIDELRGERSNLKRSIDNLIRGQEDLNNRLNEMKSQAEASVREKDKASQKLEEALAEFSEYKSESVSALRRATEALDAEALRVTELRRFVDIEKERTRQAECTCDRLKDRISVLERIIDDLRDEAEDDKYTISELRQEVAEAERRINEMRTELSAAQATANECQRMMDEKAARRTLLKMKALARKEGREMPEDSMDGNGNEEGKRNGSAPSSVRALNQIRKQLSQSEADKITDVSRRRGRGSRTNVITDLLERSASAAADLPSPSPNTCGSNVFSEQASGEKRSKRLVLPSLV
mmetsp:Transcript_6306/g.9515  ORF Transcript_6306/g.9515 Transcript_6306/m.9515 type:complete len:667 (+) Transcript_6306:146-2146(+)|eukprot:CAMPEP_0185031512 /NCGR_PEP_ID=MMETSP1103-20130426/19021_1 /TAXON_ID=36769 /ORGANISM="Paraphysomonas bandaiensis, Strain Caron Lab Isolate" /LENGTH=666 /DNA_ID=CAMNT_0027567057 /DNA_START=62 /DNA_END=2062 /DNA_ORIENTATION=+